MKNERLGFGIERMLNGGDELVAQEAAFGEIWAIFEVDKGNFGSFVGLESKLVESNEGVVFLAKIIVGDERSGGAEDGFWWDVLFCERSGDF